MKRFALSVCVLLGVCSLSAFALTNITQKAIPIAQVLPADQWRIQGNKAVGQVTSNDLPNIYVRLAELTGIADTNGLTTVMISNVVLQVVLSNETIIAGGSLIVGAGSTITVPAASIAAASIASGTFGSGVRVSSLIVSNVNGVAVFSNATIYGSCVFNGTPVYSDGLAAGSLCTTTAIKTLMLR